MKKWKKINLKLTSCSLYIVFNLTLNLDENEWGAVYWFFSLSKIGVTKWLLRPVFPQWRSKYTSTNHPEVSGRLPNPIDREDFGDVIKMVLGGGF